jgi:hypothetical protein
MRRVNLGIGGDEICHLLEWVDFSGNSAQPVVAPLTDPTNGLTFLDFDAGPQNPLLKTNQIFPVLCEFISRGLPQCVRSFTLRGQGSEMQWAPSTGLLLTGTLSIQGNHQLPLPRRATQPKQ